MSKPAKVSVRIKVQSGDEVVELTASSPLWLSGDKRRWKRQIREHLDGRVETLSVQVADSLKLEDE